MHFIFEIGELRPKDLQIKKDTRKFRPKKKYKCMYNYVSDNLN